MINLLPQQKKDQLVSEERFKLSVIFGIVILSSLLSFALILFALKFYLLSQLEVQNNLLDQKMFDNPQIVELEKDIKNSNKIITDLDSFYGKEYSLSEILSEVIKAVPPGVSFNSLSFESIKEGQYKAKFSISGLSTTRESLLEFKEKLEENGSFKEISFPSSIWVEPVNIAFTVSFKTIK
ncbi:MAG: PilN domain-containing protein [Candidatus Paceibacterota bacterium]